MRCLFNCVSDRLRNVWSWFAFCHDFVRFRRMSRAASPSREFSMYWRDRLPYLQDKHGTTGFGRHYFYHLGWAARILAASNPKLHVDISSSVNFCSIISAFIPVKFCEYHPPNVELDRLQVQSVDIRSLPFKNESVESLSCMHVVEHIGLGRYGDRLEPQADVRAMHELERTVVRNGQLLLVVPVGRPRIVFNAHRVYGFEQITSCFAKMKLKEFALIPDDPRQGGMIRDASPSLADKQVYGCGCFWFTKP